MEIFSDMMYNNIIEHLCEYFRTENRLNVRKIRYVIIAYAIFSYRQKGYGDYYDKIGRIA